MSDIQKKETVPNLQEVLQQSEQDLSNPFYRIYLPGDEQKIINQLVLLAPGRNPEEESYKLANAKQYAALKNLSLEDAYLNLDILNEEWIGKKLDPKSNFEAVADSLQLGMLMVEQGKLAKRWRESGGADPEIEKQLDALTASMQKLQDRAPRPWYIEALKAGANSLPFMGTAMISGLAYGTAAAGLATAILGTGGIGGAAAIPAAVYGGMFTFGNFLESMDMMEGAQYYDLRKQGIHHSIAAPLSALSGVIQGYVEVGLGNLAGATGSILTKGATETVTAKVLKKLALSGKMGAVGKWLAEQAGELVEESAEEGVQELTQIVTEALAEELSGVVRADPKTIQEHANRIWEATKGGFLASLVIGPVTGFPALLRGVGEAQQVKKIATLPKPLALKELANLDSIQALPAEERQKAIDALYEAASQKLTEEQERELAKVPTEELVLGATPGEEKRKARFAEVLEGEDYRAFYTDESGQPSAWVDYTIDDEGVVHIDELSRKRGVPLRDLSNLIIEIGRENPGAEIEMEPETASQRAIYEALQKNNPRGPDKGIQYFASTEEAQNFPALEAFKQRLIQTVPSLKTKADINVLTYSIDRFAKSVGVSSEEFLQKAFVPGVIQTEKLKTTDVAQGRVAGAKFIRLNDSIKTAIYLSEKANGSSVLHELTHGYTNFLVENREDPAIAPIVQRIEKAFGIENGNWEAEATGWTAQYKGENKNWHEYFAYALEDYALTGNVPKPELKPLFDRILQWLKDLYKKIVQRTTPNEEVKKFFSELFGEGVHGEDIKVQTQRETGIKTTGVERGGGTPSKPTGPTPPTPEAPPRPSPVALPEKDTRLIDPDTGEEILFQTVENGIERRKSYATDSIPLVAFEEMEEGPVQGSISEGFALSVAKELQENIQKGNAYGRLLRAGISPHHPYTPFLERILMPEQGGVELDYTDAQRELEIYHRRRIERIGTLFTIQEKGTEVAPFEGLVAYLDATYQEARSFVDTLIKDGYTYDRKGEALPVRKRSVRGVLLEAELPIGEIAESLGISPVTLAKDIDEELKNKYPQEEERKKAYRIAGIAGVIDRQGIVQAVGEELREGEQAGAGELITTLYQTTVTGGKAQEAQKALEDIGAYRTLQNAGPDENTQVLHRIEAYANALAQRIDPEGKLRKSYVELYYQTTGKEEGQIDLGLEVYHGTAHDFDRFSLDHIGKGEGTQYFGYGLYFTERYGIAKAYAEATSRKYDIKPFEKTLKDIKQAEYKGKVDKQIYETMRAGLLYVENEIRKLRLQGYKGENLKIEAEKTSKKLPDLILQYVDKNIKETLGRIDYPKEKIKFYMNEKVSKVDPEKGYYLGVNDLLDTTFIIAKQLFYTDQNKLDQLDFTFDLDKSIVRPQQDTVYLVQDKEGNYYAYHREGISKGFDYDIISKDGQPVLINVIQTDEEFQKSLMSHTLMNTRGEVEILGKAIRKEGGKGREEAILVSENGELKMKKIYLPTIEEFIEELKKDQTLKGYTIDNQNLDNSALVKQVHALFDVKLKEYTSSLIDKHAANENKPTRIIYKTKIAVNEDEILHYHNNLTEKFIKKHYDFLEREGFLEEREKMEREVTGEDLLSHLRNKYGDKEASLVLLANGIKVIKYKAGTVMRTGVKGYNYVVIDDSLIDIIDKTYFQTVREELEKQTEQEASLRAYHGTTYDFDRFSLEYVGKGEGSQAFGWGIYFSDYPLIAEKYAEIVSEKIKGIRLKKILDTVPYRQDWALIAEYEARKFEWFGGAPTKEILWGKLSNRMQRIPQELAEFARKQRENFLSNPNKSIELPSFYKDVCYSNSLSYTESPIQLVITEDAAKRDPEKDWLFRWGDEKSEGDILPYVMRNISSHLYEALDDQDKNNYVNYLNVLQEIPQEHIVGVRGEDGAFYILHRYLPYIDFEKLLKSGIPLAIIEITDDASLKNYIEQYGKDLPFQGVASIKQFIDIIKKRNVRQYTLKNNREPSADALVEEAQKAIEEIAPTIEKIAAHHTSDKQTNKILYHVSLRLKPEEILPYHENLSIEFFKRHKDFLDREGILLKDFIEEYGEKEVKHFAYKGMDLVRKLQDKYGPKEASLILAANGIKAIKYLSGTFSGIKSDRFNYVVIDDVLIDILEKEYYQTVPQEDPKNPIPYGPGVSDQAKLDALIALSHQSDEFMRPILSKIDSLFHVRSFVDFKKPEKILEKAHRPSILARKPWYGIEHISDAYRFTTVIKTIEHIPQIFKQLYEQGIEALVVSTKTLAGPTVFGYRGINLDLRLPNDQVVEHQLNYPHIQEAKEGEGHRIYNKWRTYTEADIKGTERYPEYLDDIRKSNELYEAAFSADLAALDLDRHQFLAALRKAEESLESVIWWNSSSSSGIRTRSTQPPSLRLSTAEKSGVMTSVSFVPSFRATSSKDLPISSSLSSIFQNLEEFNRELQKTYKSPLWQETIEENISIPKDRKVEEDVRTLQRIDIRGNVLKSFEDLIKLLYPYSQKLVEAFHFVFTGPEGEILAHNIISAFSPVSTPALELKDPVYNMVRIKDRMERLGATGLYIVHNHPSGVIIESNQDRQIRYYYLMNLPEQVKFKGSIIMSKAGAYALYFKNDSPDRKGWIDVGKGSVSDDIKLLIDSPQTLVEIIKGVDERLKEDYYLFVADYFHNIISYSILTKNQFLSPQYRYSKVKEAGGVECFLATRDDSAYATVLEEVGAYGQKDARDSRYDVVMDLINLNRSTSIYQDIEGLYINPVRYYDYRSSLSKGKFLWQETIGGGIEESEAVIRNTLEERVTDVTTIPQDVNKEEELQKLKRIELRGKVLKDTEGADLVRLLQPYSDMGFEAIHHVYVDENEKILAHNVLSAFLPSAGLAVEKNDAYHVYRVQDRIKRLKADGFYVVHNHPGGDPSESPSDRYMRGLFEEMFRKQFRGSLIIAENGRYTFNHSNLGSQSGEYRSIQKGNVKLDDRPRIQFREQLQDMLHALYRKTEADYILLVADSGNRPLSYSVLTKAQFKSPAYQYRKVKEAGGAWAYLGTTDQTAYDEIIQYRDQLITSKNLKDMTIDVPMDIFLLNSSRKKMPVYLRKPLGYEAWVMHKRTARTYLWQTEGEEERHTNEPLEEVARSFKNVEDFIEAMESGLWDSPVPNDLSNEEKAQWYKDFYQRAMKDKPVEPVEESFVAMLRKDNHAGLKAFLYHIWDALVTAKKIEMQEIRPETEEEKLEIEELQKVTQKVEVLVAPTLKRAAINMGSKNKEPSKHYLSVIYGIIAKNEAAYMQLYGQLLGDEAILQRGQELLEEEIAKLEPSATRTLSISQRRALAETLKRAELVDKVMSGRISEAELTPYLTAMQEELKETRKKQKELQEELNRSRQVMGAQEKKLLEQKKYVDELQKRKAYIEKRIERMIEKGKGVPEELAKEKKKVLDAYRTAEKSYQRLKEKLKGSAALIEHLAKLEEATKLKVKYREQQAARKAAKKLREYRKYLIWKILQPPAKNVNVTEAEQIKQIQRLFKKRLEKTKEFKREMRELFKNMLQFGQGGILKEDDIEPILERETNELTLEDLEKIHEQIQVLRRKGKEEYEIKKRIREQRDWANRTTIINELMRSKTFAQAPAAGSEEAKEREGGVVRRGLKTTDYYFTGRQQFAIKLDGGKEGRNYELLIKRENEALRNKLEYASRRKKNILEAFKRAGIQPGDWYKEPVQIPEAGPFNETVTMRKSDLAALWIAFKDEDSRKAALYGNFFNQYERDITDRKMIETMGARREALIRQAFDQYLTEADKKVIEEIEKDWNESGNRIAAVIERVENRVMDRVKNYYPIMRQDGSQEIDPRSLAEDYISRTGIPQGPKRGFTKKRIHISPNHQKPIRLDLLTTFLKTVDLQEHYIAYAEYLKELNGTYLGLRAAGVREAIKQAHGRQALEYLKDLLAEYAKPSEYLNAGRWETAVRWLRGNLGVAYLGFRPSSAMKQWLTSIWPALPYAGPRLLTSALKFLSNPVQYLKEAEGKSVILRERTLDPVKNLLEEAVMSADSATKKAFAEIREKSWILVEMADRISVAIGWRAIYEKELEATGDEKKAIERADELIQRTQPSGRLADVAPAYRNKSEFARAFLQFTLSLNVIWNNIRHDLPNAVRQHQYGTAVGIVMAYAIAGVCLNAGMRALKSALGGEDDEERDWIEYVYYALTQGTDAIPLIGEEVTGAAKLILTGKRGRGYEEELYPAISSLFKSLEAVSKEKWDRAVEEFLGGGGMILGMPVWTIREIYRSIKEESLKPLAGGQVN